LFDAELIVDRRASDGAPRVGEQSAAAFTRRWGGIRGAGRRVGRGARCCSAAVAWLAAASRAGALLERAVGTVLVVMADVRAHNLFEVAAAEDQDPVEAFAPRASHPALGLRLRPWRPHRCADHPDTFGAEHLVKARVNLLSRSRTRRKPVVRAPRASSPGCGRVTPRSCGFAVTPPKWTRRFASSMKNSTYKRRSQTVSTLRKSQATIADACARGNSDQLNAARRGAGSIPCRRKIDHTVLGASVIPSPLRVRKFGRADLQGRPGRRETGRDRGGVSGGR
jgi:hypothetical protein